MSLPTTPEELAAALRAMRRKATGCFRQPATRAVYAVYAGALELGALSDAADLIEQQARELAELAQDRADLRARVIELSDVQPAREAPVPAPQPAAAPIAQEPVAWIRWRSSGGHEGPIVDYLMDPVRKESGVWTPLYASQQPASKAPSTLRGMLAQPGREPVSVEQMRIGAAQPAGELLGYVSQKTVDFMRWAKTPEAEKKAKGYVLGVTAGGLEATPRFNEIPVYLAAAPGKFHLGAVVRKKSGAQWQGRIVGSYSTALTPVGWAVESSAHPGSVQIYPEAALDLVEGAAAQPAEQRTDWSAS